MQQTTSPRNEDILAARRRVRLSRQLTQFLSTLSGLIVLFVIFSIANPNFRSALNIRNLGIQVTPILLIAMGQTFVLITGGIDLSIGSNIGLAGVVTCMVIVAGGPIWIALIAGLLCGVAVGALNGSLIAYAKLPPFIATLGTMTAVRGLTMVITHGIPVSGLPQAFKWFGARSTLGIPNQIFILVALVVVFALVLSKTRTGRYTYAIGSNYDAARLSGVDTRWATVKVFAISGFLAAVAGVIMASQINSGPPTAGDGYELDAVAASVIGGASTMGGEGIIPGTVVGALIIAVLRNGLNLSGIDPFYQKIAIGLVIIIAVFQDRIRRKD